MRRYRFLLKPLSTALLGLGFSAAIAAPFGVPFIPLPAGSSGNRGDTSAYFGMQLDPDTLAEIYPEPNVYGCPKSVAGGGICRTDFNNFDTRYRYDSVRWRMFDGGSTGLIGSISWRDRDLDMFRKIYFGYAFDANAPGNLVPAFSQPINYSLYSDYSGRETSQTYQLTTESLVLHNVRLSLDVGSSGAANPLDLVFDGPKPGIQLSNSSLLLGAASLQVTGLAPFSIHAAEGLNSIERFERRILIDAPTVITISPGAWLSFSDFTKGLEFRGKSNSLNAVGLNQDGGLELKRGTWRFDNGVAQFSQGATLRLVGSGTSATFDRLQFATGAKLAMENGTSLEANIVNLFGSTTTIGDGATLVAKTIEMLHDNRIDSGNYAARWGSVQTNFLGLLDGARVELNGLGDLKVRGQMDIGNGLGKTGTGAVLSLNRSDVTAYEHVYVYNGSELNLTDRAAFTLRPDKGTHESPDALLRGAMALGAPIDNPARINVGSSAFLNVVYGGQIDISDQLLRLKIDRSGGLFVKGNLRGSGHIEGDGLVALQNEGTFEGKTVSGGWLFPGTLPNPIATLSTDTALYFGQGSQLRVNVGRDIQGQLTHGRALYGAGNVTLDGRVTLALAQIPGQAPLKASELNGKSITMLSARDAAVTGTILPSLYKPQIDVSAMPALLTWRLVDLQTNQHPDLTLQADTLPLSGLQKNTGSKNNRTSGLDLMVTAATQNPTSPIAGALDTLTNAQLGVSGTVTLPGSSPGTPGSAPVLPTPAQAQGSPVAQQNSWHPEPYSSYIAVGLAHIANLRNVVFEQTMLTTPSGTRAWADAAGFRGAIEGQGDLGSYRYSMSQLAIGKDMGELRGGAWGGYLAASQHKTDEHDLQSQKISGTSLGLGAYWRHQGPIWTTMAQVGVARGEHDSIRQLSVGGYSSTPRGRYTSQSVQAALRFGAPWFEFRGMEVSQEFGASVTLYRQSGFDETGDARFGFRVKPARADAYIAHAGAHARFPELKSMPGVRPVAFARLEHDFAVSKDHEVEASLLANPTASAAFVGQGRGANSAVVGLGLRTEKPGPWQVQGGLIHSWHTHGRDWGAGAKIRYSW